MNREKKAGLWGREVKFLAVSLHSRKPLLLSDTRKQITLPMSILLEQPGFRDESRDENKITKVVYAGAELRG